MYYEDLSENKKRYFNILCKEFPDWLKEYIDTIPMWRIDSISADSGITYTKLFPKHEWYSNLDHSVAVALITWNFTKNKILTLTALFHDIGTPVFKHCIDFMNPKNEQEMEEKRKEVLKNSTELQNLLKNDQINWELLTIPTKYPLIKAENPKLSIERLENIFHQCYFFYQILDLNEIEKYYTKLEIVPNESNKEELGFQDIETAETFLEKTRKLWEIWISDTIRSHMQFIADICHSMIYLKFVTIDDLYQNSETEFIRKIENCPQEDIKNAWKNYTQTTTWNKHEYLKPNKYSCHTSIQRKYVNPLVKQNENYYRRIYNLSRKAFEIIDTYLKLPSQGYNYLDFNFIPYKEKTGFILKK